MPIQMNQNQKKNKKYTKRYKVFIQLLKKLMKFVKKDLKIQHIFKINKIIMKIIELKEMMNHQLKMSQKNMKREQLFINNLEHIIEYSYVEKYIQKIKNKNKDLVEKCSLDFLDDIRKFIKYNI